MRPVDRRMYGRHGRCPIARVTDPPSTVAHAYAPISQHLLLAMPPRRPRRAIAPSPPRAFGHFALRRLLGKSEATMLWLALDPRTGLEPMLTMPRVQPADAAALEHLAAATCAPRSAARPSEPRQGRRDAACTTTGRSSPSTAASASRSRSGCAQHPVAGRSTMRRLDRRACCAGLAFGHDAGVAHHDLQLHHILSSTSAARRA